MTTMKPAPTKAQPVTIDDPSGRRTPVPGPFLRDHVMRLTAEVVDDLENVRNANQNRLRQLTRVGPDKDGRNRGFGMSFDHPDVRRLASLVAAIDEDLDMAVKNLEAVMKTHPLWIWGKPITGLGAKQFARLLGALGDPYWNEGDNRPRTLGELYSYSGFAPVDGVARKRVRGELANWNDTVKMRAYLIAESFMKQVANPDRGRSGSPYRVVYDEAREKYENAVHVEPCAQCGPGHHSAAKDNPELESTKSGQPAPVGSPLRDGHKNRRALRMVAKEFLADLYHEAERLHKEAAAKWN